MKLSFSLGSKAKPAGNNPVGQAPSLKKPAAFASLDDDTTDAAPTASSSKNVEFSKKLAIQSSGGSWRAGKPKSGDEIVTISQYDEVYDGMKEAALKAKEAKEFTDKEKKPKYMENLLQSAATRKLDYIRAEEKLIQREREQEGDEFADKDKFVTQAYKDQMEAVRKAEEEEKRREELAKKNKGLSTGMTHFYRELLQRSAEEHDATVAATQTKGPTLPPVEEPSTNLRITKPLKIAPAPAPASDAELARLARAQGKDVELNDDNQLVDKRELLAAGLNLSAPNTRKLGIASIGTKKNETVQVHRAAGTAASKREIRERQQRELDAQIKVEQQRLLEDHQRKAEEEKERHIKRKNNEEEVKSARDRYLERKRRKMEEEVSAPPNDNGSSGVV